jgi:hypothetical protein
METLVLLQGEKEMGGWISDCHKIKVTDDHHLNLN